MNKETDKNKTKECGCKECEQLQKQIEALALTVDKVEDEKLEITNQLKRALADYQNLVNDSERRNALRLFQMKKSLAESLIPSMDALALAMVASKDIKLDENGKAWLDGIAATLKSIESALAEMGLKQYIPLKGDKFDPNIHEAVTTIAQGNSGEIYDLVQPGYILDNTVIRPARVVVSK